MTDEVTPKKRGRPKGKKDSPNVQRPPQEPRERTEAQKAAQFKPGNKANADGWSMRKEIRAYRKKCDSILSSPTFTEAMVTMVVHCANNGMYKEFMEIQRFLAEYAYGKPGQMLETEENVNVLSEGNAFVPPVIGLLPGSIEDAEESDQDYV